MRDPALFLTRAIFLLAGLISLAIGFSITFLTQGFYSSTGIDLGGDVNLFSEIRASGAVLLVVALFLLGALFKPDWRPAALIVAAVYFSAYGLARLYSAFATGWAGPEITTAMVAELAIGALALGVILHNRRYRNW
jgi:hypothetical protein